MSDLGGFEESLIEALQKATDALEEGWYEVRKYQAEYRDWESWYGGSWVEGPEEAVSSLIDSLEGTDRITVTFPTSDFFSAVRSEEFEVSDLITGKIEGWIDIDEPLVEYDSDTYDAMSLIVRYKNDRDRGYFQVEALDAIEPYTLRDALDEVDEIVDVLRDEGLTAERGAVQGNIGPEGVPEELR